MPGAAACWRRARSCSRPTGSTRAPWGTMCGQSACRLRPSPCCVKASALPPETAPEMRSLLLRKAWRRHAGGDGHAIAEELVPDCARGAVDCNGSDGHRRLRILLGNDQTPEGRGGGGETAAFDADHHHQAGAGGAQRDAELAAAAEGGIAATPERDPTPGAATPQGLRAAPELREPPAQADEEEAPVLEEFRRLLLVPVTDELEDPAHDEHGQRPAPEPVSGEARDRKHHRQGDDRDADGMACPVGGVCVTGRFLRDPLFRGAMGGHGVLLSRVS